MSISQRKEVWPLFMSRHYEGGMASVVVSHSEGGVAINLYLIYMI